MRTATHRSWITRSLVIVFVIATSPVATFGQNDGPPRAVREFSVQQVPRMFNAIETGGLNEQEAAAAQTAIEQIDARLATAPPA